MFLDDLVGFVLLLGVYGLSIYGDPIPAILINTPVNALRGGPARRGIACFVTGVFCVLFWRVFFNHHGSGRAFRLRTLSVRSGRLVRLTRYPNGGDTCGRSFDRNDRPAIHSQD